MNLDEHTLLLTMLLVVALVAGACCLIWLQDRKQAAILWMAISAALTCAGVVGLVALPLEPRIPLVMPLFLISFALFWTALRSLRGLPPRFSLILLPVAAWLAFCFIPEFRASMNLRIGAGMLLLLLPVAYSAHELWLQREESLPLRAGVLTLLAIQALLMLHRAYFSLMHLNIPEPTLKVAPWTEAMMLDFMGLMLVFSFTIIAFVKDQSLRQQCTIARCDVLTGVGNRFYFEETLRRHFRRAQIAGQSLALIMADADGFKQYNDLYGHPAGDRCLRVIATALTGACRPSDTVGRYGGEEFAVLLPNTSIDAALTVAQRMLTRVRELNLEHTGNPQGFVSISLGVAAFIPSSQETTAEDLVEAADHALYRAKREGRDRVCSGTQTHQSAIWATQS